MLTIIAIGKIKENYIQNAVDDYMKRISYYDKISIIELKENLGATSLQTRENEGRDILAKINPNAFVILNDLGGKLLSSEELSKVIDDAYIFKGGNIVFVIGGSDGVSNAVKQRADFKLAFSNMTFPHQLFRVILFEQIYRSFKIIKNETYHK